MALHPQAGRCHGEGGAVEIRLSRHGAGDIDNGHYMISVVGCGA
ncbi:hypothetical protein SB521682_1878 [Shigella boydii 5216-82]|nr:hypothetical protein SB521682_1878 [Shigella boydii 5216-82]